MSPDDPPSKKKRSEGQHHSPKQEINETRTNNEHTGIVIDTQVHEKRHLWLNKAKYICKQISPEWFDLKSAANDLTKFVFPVIDDIPCVI